MSDRTPAQHYATLDTTLAETQTAAARIVAKISAARHCLRSGVGPARIGNLVLETERVKDELAQLLIVAFGAADGWSHEISEARQEAIVAELRGLIDRGNVALFPPRPANSDRSHLPQGVA